MGWWRKASNQNNVEEVISYHISYRSCVHSQRVAVCSCSYLAQSRTKSYYLSIKKHCTSTSSQEEARIFVNISCLTQRKQKHLSRFKQMLQFSLHCMVASSPPFSKENRTHKLGHENKKCVKT